MTENERELDLQLGEALARIGELEREIERLTVRLDGYERTNSANVQPRLSHGPLCTAYHVADEDSGETD